SSRSCNGGVTTSHSEGRKGCRFNPAETNDDCNGYTEPPCGRSKASDAGEIGGTAQSRRPFPPVLRCTRSVILDCAATGRAIVTADSRVAILKSKSPRPTSFNLVLPWRFTSAELLIP